VGFGIGAVIGPHLVQVAESIGAFMEGVLLGMGSSPFPQIGGLALSTLLEGGAKLHL